MLSLRLVSTSLALACVGACGSAAPKHAGGAGAGAADAGCRAEEPPGRCGQPEPPAHDASLPMHDADAVGGPCRDLAMHTPADYRLPASCAAIRESSYCVSIIASKATYVGVDTGATCTTVSAGGFASSLGRLGGDLLRCNEDLVERVSLVDGTSEFSDVPCDAAFDLDGAIVVQGKDHTGLTRYATWQAMLAGDGTPITFMANRDSFASLGDQLVATDHVAAEVDIGTAAGENARTLTLEGFDDWIDGLDLTPSGELVIASRDGIHVFDASTGAALRTFPFVDAVGLVCFGGATAEELAMQPAVPGTPRPDYATRREGNYVLGAPTCYPDEQASGGKRYATELGAGPELYVIGSHDPGTHRVRDQRTQPHVLVLVSSDVVTWSVEPSPSARIERIIAYSGEPGTKVMGVGSVQTEVRASPLRISSEYPSSGAIALRDLLEKELHRELNEMVSCSTGPFVVRDIGACETTATP